MNLDYEPSGEDQELIKIWQQSLSPAGIDSAHFVQEFSGRMRKFDRKVWWRNFREYAVGALLIAYFSWQLSASRMRLLPIAGIAAVGFVMAYLWWSHRQTPPLDPAADARSYRAALLNRYDRQIRLLSGVKYWYVLPLYSWMLLSIMTTIPAHDAKRRIVAGIIPTAFSLFVIWLNEIYAVKKLRLKRMQVEELLDEGKS